MGTDTRGKREVSDDLVAKAQLFTDEVAQAISIGECQHAFAAGLVAQDDITPLGEVILKRPRRAHLRRRDHLVSTARASVCRICSPADFALVVDRRQPGLSAAP